MERDNWDGWTLDGRVYSVVELIEKAQVFLNASVVTQR